MEEASYKGYAIRYVEGFDEWVANDAHQGRVAANKSRPQLLAMIDRLVKSEFKRFKIIHNLRVGTVTSINFNGIWVTYMDKRKWSTREKLSNYDIRNSYPVTPANIEKIEQINGMEKEKDALDAKIDALKKTFEPFSAEQRKIFKEFGFFQGD